MKKKSIALLTFLLGALALMTPSAFAFDAAQEPQEALASLKNLDCRVDRQACEYFAAVEVAAYFDACPVVYGQLTGNHATPETLQRLENLLSSWVIFERSPALKEAVLTKENKLRKYLSAEIVKYLSAIPRHEIDIECTRISMVKDGKSAESMADILKTTRNYEEFAEERHAQEQAEFTANQERLRREAAKGAEGRER